jgi:DNA invertase Pin-like site-specific DNA recombinase
MRALIAARKSNKVDSATGEGIGLDTQDEKARAFCERLGIDVVGLARDTISGRLAPIDRPDLGAWLGDPARRALFDVVIAYRADRLSRGEDTDWSRIETWAADHGKTLILVDGSTGIRYPARDDSDRWQWMSAKTQAGKEWNDIRERIIRSTCAIMRAGYWVGRAPWSYRIEGDRYRKSLVADPTLVDYLRAVYYRAIKGDSLRMIAAWLESEGVRTERGNAVWSESVVGKILANTTYSGTHTRTCVECGGSHDITVPALVDMATQRRATDALRSRVRGSNNGGRPSANPAMFVPMCDACGVPMYRIVSNVKGHRYEHYYCKRRTTGGVRRGCGLMVRCDLADAFADRILSADTEPETTVTISYPAAALESEIERVRRVERSAFEADDIEKMLELRAERDALVKQLATTERERVEKVPVTDPKTGEVQTVGHVWQSLNPADRRDWLKRRGIDVLLTKTSVKLGGPWRDAETGERSPRRARPVDRETAQRHAARIAAG